MNKDRLIRLAKETVDIGECGFYTASDGTEVDLTNNINRMIGNTFVIDNDTTINANDAASMMRTTFNGKNIIVSNRNTNESIDYWGALGKKAVALNFASAKNPGGGFLNGMDTQEESITRASLLYKSLTSKMEYYDRNRRNLNRGLYIDSAIYSTDVPFIRDMRTPGEYLRVPEIADVITIAAVNRGAAMRNKVSEAEINLAMINRIDFVMKVFISRAAQCQWDNSVLILGAYGCGVFKNKPDIVAEIFKAVITKYRFELGRLNVIVDFAIPGGVNLEAFKLKMGK